MRRFIFIALILAAAAAGVYVGLHRGARTAKPSGPALEVTFTDATLGNAIIIQTPEGRFAVVDPGPRETAQSLAARLTSMGARSLDVIITSPTEKHMGAVDALVAAFKVKRIIHGELLMWNKPKGVPELVLSRGDSIHLARGTKLEVMGPPKGLLAKVAHSTDNNSLITRIRFGQTSFLLASDARTEAEAELMRSEVDLASTVLLAARQGRAGGTTLEWLSMVRPQYCVIQVGRRSDRPSRSVLTRLDTQATGAALYRTDRDGSVKMISDGRAITVETGGGQP